MRKSLKRITALALSACMVGAMAGCGNGDSGTTAAPKDNTTAAQEKTTAGGETTAAETKGGDSEKQVTLRFSWWGGDSRHEATLEAIKAYEKAHPNVKIEGEYQGYDGYYEKMITTLSSGTAPDIMQFHRDWIADVQGAKHYLADMSKLPVDLTTLDQTVLSGSGTYNDEPVLYSCSIGGQIMYVNKEFADKHGLDLEKVYTWEEIMALGKEIHDANPDEYLMTADIDVLNRLIILEYLAQMTGGSIVNEDYSLNFTEEQMTAALQNIKDLYETGTMEPFGESAVFVGQMEQNTKWVNGQIGILLDITGATAKYAASIEAELDCMSIPVMKDAKSSGVDFSGNMGFVINDASENKEEAAKFLDWMMNDEEAIKILKDCRGYPATSTAIDVMTKENLLNPVMKKATEIAGDNNPFSINAISGNTELETIRKDIIQEVIYGDSTPEEGAKEMVESYTEVLETLKNK